MAKALEWREGIGGGWHGDREGVYAVWPEGSMWRWRILNAAGGLEPTLAKAKAALEAALG